MDTDRSVSVICTTSHDSHIENELLRATAAAALSVPILSDDTMQLYMESARGQLIPDLYLKHHELTIPIEPGLFLSLYEGERGFQTIEMGKKVTAIFRAYVADMEGALARRQSLGLPSMVP